MDDYTGAFGACGLEAAPSGVAQRMWYILPASPNQPNRFTHRDSGTASHPNEKRVNPKPARPNRGVASSQTARAINRDIVLQTIHMRQPVSRADLARLTGLQASTVSLILGELIEEAWVSPGILGHLPRGRRPTFVTLNDQHVALAIDLRPARANLGIIDINGKILRRETIEFPAARQRPSSAPGPPSPPSPKPPRR